MPAICSSNWRRDSRGRRRDSHGRRRDSHGRRRRRKRDSHRRRRRRDSHRRRRRASLRNLSYIGCIGSCCSRSFRFNYVSGFRFLRGVIASTVVLHLQPSSFQSPNGYFNLLGCPILQVKHDFQPVFLALGWSYNTRHCPIQALGPGC